MTAAEYVAEHHDLAQPTLRRYEAVVAAMPLLLPSAFNAFDLAQRFSGSTTAELSADLLNRWRDDIRAGRVSPRRAEPVPLVMHPVEFAAWCERLGGPPFGVEPSEPVAAPPPDDGPVRLVVSG